MSRQDIADFLRLIIETVSRTFAKLERVIEIMPGAISLADGRESRRWPQHDVIARVARRFRDPF